MECSFEGDGTERSSPGSDQVFQKVATQRAKRRPWRAKGLHLASRKVEKKEAASQGEFACKCIPLELSRASDTVESLPYTHHAASSPMGTSSSSRRAH